MERAQCGDVLCGFFPRLLGVILRALRHAGRDHRAPVVDVAIETCAEHHKKRHTSQAGAVHASTQALDAGVSVGRRHAQRSGTMGERQDHVPCGGDRTSGESWALTPSFRKQYEIRIGRLRVPGVTSL